MGYAKSSQDTAGIHFRLYSRAFVLADERGTRIVMVNCDLAMISQIVKIEVSIVKLNYTCDEGRARVTGVKDRLLLSWWFHFVSSFCFCKKLFPGSCNCLNPNTTPAVNCVFAPSLSSLTFTSRLSPNP